MILKRGLLTLFILIVCVYSVNASVIMSQPNSAYNLGDSVDLNISIDPIVDGPLKIKLVCGDTSTDVFSGPPIENMVLPLNYLWIHNLKGSCYFEANYNGDIKKTNPNFIISDQLNVVMNSDSFFAKPDEIVSLSGKVSKADGSAANGEVEISIPFKVNSNANVSSSDTSSDNNITSNENVSDENSSSNETADSIDNTSSNIDTENSENSNYDSGKFYGKVIDGEFSADIRMPSDIPAGEYRIEINAYDFSSTGTKLNSGISSARLTISQVLRAIELAINEQSFDPLQNISIKPRLLDQTNQTISDQTSIVIYNERNEKLFERVLPAGETAIYEIPSDLPSSYYTIEASLDDYKVQKTFFVNEKPRITFELGNETLYVKNIGNVRYNKSIQIEVGGKPFVKSLDLDVGEAKIFYLYGENQAYNVKASDGENLFNQDNVMLTGHAIDVSDTPYRDIFNFFSMPIVWIFLLLIIVVAILLVLRKVIKKKSIARPTDYSYKSLKLDHVMKKEKPAEPKSGVATRKMISVSLVPPTQAEPGLVTHGHRNKSSLVALKIKNKITPFTKDYLQKTINIVYDKKATVYEHGEYVIIILSPLITKTFKNEIEASRLAESISNSLFEYNKKFKEHIEFGIGVNCGEIISEIKDRKMIFTALGNSLILAKKLAEFSNGDVLLSEDVYHKEMNEIKADRKTFGEIVGFQMKKIMDHDKNKKFIDDFLKRAEKDSGVKYVRSDGTLSRNRVGSGLPSANGLLRDAAKNESVNSNSVKFRDFR